MASHFASLGFPISDVKGMRRLAGELTPKAQELPAGDGAYLRWAPGSGEELWLQVDRRRDFSGMNPHFSGVSRLRLGLEQRIKIRGATPLDGAFEAFVLDEEDEAVAQLIFDCPDAVLHAGVPLPAIATAQIAAFAHDVEIHESVEAFEAAQVAEGGGPDQLRFASQSFFPSGVFAKRPEATAILSGHVIDSGLRTNALTNDSYTWAAVESVGGVYDVVASPDVIPSAPPLGGVVLGSFWLSGRLLDEPRPAPDAVLQPVEEERRGLLRRIFD